ncbi:MAG: DNA polymerase [Patescibacteria group bacterium]
MSLNFDPDKPNYSFVTTDKDYKEALEDLEKRKVLAVDTECTSLDPFESKILLIQIATPEKSYVLDARKLDMKLLKGLLEDSTKLKLLQNSKFDYSQLKAHYDISMTNIFDTMLAERLLTCGLERRNSLGAIVEKYLNIKLKKEVRKSFEGLMSQVTEEQIRYAAMDVLVLFPVFEKQWELLQKEDLVKVARLEFSTVRVVAEMELRGLAIDAIKWKSVIVGLQKKRDELAAKIQETIRPLYKIQQMDLFGGAADVINLNSQQQLLELFNDKLGLAVASTGDSVLEFVNHPVAALMREYRAHEKLISAFGESILEKINKRTGRIHPDFQQIGADTGRFSCNNPNLQQIPRESKEAPFRSCFVPTTGYKYVVADYSSMEMRIVADFTGDENLIKAFEEGWDVHSATAALMFNKEYTPDFKKKFPDLRQAAKTINFGLVYGMGPGRLAVQIGVDTDTAKGYMTKYFETFKQVKAWLDSAARFAVKNGYSMTPIGRKRWYQMPDKSDPNYDRLIGGIERQGKNHPIQGANADATKYALVFLLEKFKELKVDGGIILTVHDEIVCEIREDQAEDWAKVQQEQMEKAAGLFMKKCKPKAEAIVSSNWEH